MKQYRHTEDLEVKHEREGYLSVYGTKKTSESEAGRTYSLSVVMSVTGRMMDGILSER